MRVEFEGKVVEFPDDFSDQEISAALDSLSPKQETPWYEGMGRAIPRGLASGVASLVYGGRQLQATSNELFGNQARADEFRTKAEQELKLSQTMLDRAVAPPQSFAGKATETATAMLPVIGGGVATLAPGILGGTTMLQKRLMDEGVAPQQATTVAQVQMGGMAAMAAIPTLRPIASVLANTLSGAAADEVSRQLLSEYEKSQEQFTPTSEEYWVQRVAEILPAYIFADRSKKAGPKIDVDPDQVGKNLENVRQAPEPEPPAPQPVPQRQLDLPLEPPIVDTTSRVNPYDIGGEVTRLKGNMETGLDGQLGLFDADTPSPLRTAIEGAEARIDDQYSRIENIEDFAESWKAGRTSENVGLENKLLNDEYGKLDLLQRERAELGDTPTEVRAYSDAIRNLGSRRQSGALDLQVYSEGFKRFSRALSRLTDQSWLKARFPSSEYMTNSDDTPLVMLHGTKREFFTKLRPSTGYSAEGIHLGFTVPAHLIQDIRLRTSATAKKTGRNILSATGHKSYEAEISDARKKISGANIHPQVIKKGNYPFINYDVGMWDPRSLLSGNVSVRDNNGVYMTFREFVTRNATHPLHEDLWRQQAFRILALQPEQRAVEFSRFLKNQGIDGFFYRNQAESLSRPRFGSDSGRYQKGAKSVNPLQDAISFVTWNPDNVRSIYDPPANVPASQRGGAKGKWNPYEAKQKFLSLVRNWRKGSDDFIAEVNREREALEAIRPKLDIDKKQSVFEKAGLKGVELIPEAEPLTPEKLQELKNTPDIGKTSAFVPGALAVAEHNKGNKAVLWFHKLLDSGWKKGQYYSREIVRPVEEQLKPLLRNEKSVKIMHKIFVEESKRRSRFSKEELTQAGVPQQIIEVYEPFRKVLDDAWKIQNEERKKKGLPELPYEHAHLSHRWSGPWTVAIYERVFDEKGRSQRGKVVTYIKENNKYAANYAVRYLKQKGLLDENKYIVDPVRYIGGKGDSSPFRALYSDILGLLDKDSVAAQQIRAALEEEAMLRTVDVGQQEKHFLKKSGTQGWRGNRPWASDDNSLLAKTMVGDSVTDARDMFVQQIEYAKSAFMWSSYQKSISDARLLLSDEEFVKSHPNFSKWATVYARRHAGLGSKDFWSNLENGIAKGLGISTKTLESTLGMSKGGFYGHTLGMGNIPFSIAQIMQPLFTSAKHNDLSAQGYSHDPIKTQRDTFSYIARAGLIEGEAAFSKQSFIWDNADPLTKDMFAYMEANGMIDINPTTDIADLKMPEWASKVTKYSSFNVVLTEKLARTAVFASFVSHLNQSGKFPDTPQGRLDLLRKAEEATNYTMVDYRPHERAAIFDYMGLTGHALNTFTAFKFNFYSQLYSNTLKAQQGNPMPLVYFLSTLYALGGALGWIGLDDADNMIDLVKAMARQVKPLPRSVEEFSLKGLILQTPEIVAAGPVSSLSGLNLYTRFSQAEVIPVDPLNPAETFKDIFPYLNLGWDVATGIGEVGKYLAFGGDKSDALAAGYRVTPPSLRGIYEEVMPGMKSEGYAQSTSDPARGGGQYLRTESDSKKRMYGFRSTKEAVTREKDFQGKKRNTFAEDQRQKIADTFRGNLILNTPEYSAKLISRYIEWGGDPETLVAQAQINKDWINRHSTYLDRLAIAAEGKSKPAVDAFITRLKQ